VERIKLRNIGCVFPVDKGRMNYQGGDMWLGITLIASAVFVIITIIGAGALAEDMIRWKKK
jgi:hypothetical protein